MEGLAAASFVPCNETKKVNKVQINWQKKVKNRMLFNKKGKLICHLYHLQKNTHKWFIYLIIWMAYSASHVFQPICDSCSESTVTYSTKTSLPHGFCWNWKENTTTEANTCLLPDRKNWESGIRSKTFLSFCNYTCKAKLEQCFKNKM